jgi:hypothetical protein
MNTTLLNLLKWFTSINLEELESSASFMTRIDTKYLLHAWDINQVLEQFKQKYFILSIHWHYVFRYDNIYMDTKDYDLYYHHEKGRDKRIKVRTRYYVESDLAFFEFKQKEWDVTRKFRYKIESTGRQQMTDNDQRFYASIYQSIDPKAPKQVLVPSIEISFQRVTIVSKKSDERLTIDFNLTYRDLRNPKKQPITCDNLVIVESKSTSLRTYSHKLMRSYGIRPAKWCSKYGFGLIMLRNVNSRNHFLDSLATIKTIIKDTSHHGIKSPSLTLKPKQKKKIIKQHKKIQTKTTSKLNTIKKTIWSKVSIPKSPTDSNIKKTTKKTNSANIISKKQPTTSRLQMTILTPTTPKIKSSTSIVKNTAKSLGVNKKPVNNVNIKSKNNIKK